MYPIVCCSTLYNSQNMEATQMSIGRCMGNEVVVHIHNGILLSHKKEHICVSSDEVDKPRAIQSDMSQKDKYRILTQKYGIWMNGTEELFHGAEMEKQNRDQTYGHEERKGEGEMYGESNMETYIQFSSVQFSRSVVSNCLRPHESQHARPPCPSPTPRVHPNSRASSR